MSMTPPKAAWMYTYALRAIDENRSAKSKHNLVSIRPALIPNVFLAAMIAYRVSKRIDSYASKDHKQNMQQQCKVLCAHTGVEALKLGCLIWQIYKFTAPILPTLNATGRCVMVCKMWAFWLTVSIATRNVLTTAQMSFKQKNNYDRSKTLCASVFTLGSVWSAGVTMFKLGIVTSHAAKIAFLPGLLATGPVGAVIIGMIAISIVSFALTTIAKRQLDLRQQTGARLTWIETAKHIALGRNSQQIIEARDAARDAAAGAGAGAGAGC